MSASYRQDAGRRATKSRACGGTAGDVSHQGLADGWLAATRTDLERGNWIDPEAGRVPLTDYATHWLTDRPDLRPRTKEVYRSLLRLHILPLGSVELVDITPAKVRSWRVGLIDAGHPGTRPSPSPSIGMGIYSLANRKTLRKQQRH